MNEKKKLFGFMSKIREESKAIKKGSYGTSLAYEHIIVSSYQQMKTKDLIALHKIITRIIQKRHELKKADNANNK